MFGLQLRRLKDGVATILVAVSQATSSAPFSESSRQPTRDAARPRGVATEAHYIFLRVTRTFAACNAVPFLWYVTVT